MVKAVFFDIDGTLVPFGHHSIPDTTRAALQRLRDAGVKLFISTGRHPAWIDNLGDETFDGYVAANGSLCLLGDRKTEIYRHEVDHEDVKRLVPFANSHPYSFVVVPADGQIFTTSYNDNFTTSQQMLRIPFVPIRKIEDALDMRVVQMMVFTDPETIKRDRIFDDVLTHCLPTSWNPLFADIVPKGSDKGVGIRKMAEHFGIDISETMALGDGDNDIAMLRAAGIGVAMGQSAEAVKQAADYVTDTVDNDGVAKALDYFSKANSQ